MGKKREERRAPGLACCCILHNNFPVKSLGPLLVASDMLSTSLSQGLVSWTAMNSLSFPYLPSGHDLCENRAFILCILAEK